MTPDEDCGGDCVHCMAEAGDPECIAAVARISKRDEYAVWVESKDADQYAGLYVAFVPGDGPIASAETIKELRAESSRRKDA